jgi:hypothetical protein
VGIAAGYDHVAISGRERSRIPVGGPEHLPVEGLYRGKNRREFVGIDFRAPAGEAQKDVIHAVYQASLV